MFIFWKSIDEYWNFLHVNGKIFCPIVVSKRHFNTLGYRNMLISPIFSFSYFLPTVCMFTGSNVIVCAWRNKPLIFQKLWDEIWISGCIMLFTALFYYLHDAMVTAIRCFSSTNFPKHHFGHRTKHITKVNIHMCNMNNGRLLLRAPHFVDNKRHIIRATIYQ